MNITINYARYESSVLLNFAIFGKISIILNFLYLYYYFHRYKISLILKKTYRESFAFTAQFKSSRNLDRLYFANRRIFRSRKSGKMRKLRRPLQPSRNLKLESFAK